MADDISGIGFERVTSRKAKRNKRTINILGDSVVKSIQAHKMQYDMASTDKVYVKCFSGAVTSDFTHHAKPSQKYSPNMFICHLGSNDLKTAKTPEMIAKEIIKFGLELKTSDNEVLISGITYRDDRLNEKGMKVNSLVKSLCSENSLGYIDNGIIQKKHLNGSGIHLNMDGTAALAINFLDAIDA